MEQDINKKLLKHQLEILKKLYSIEKEETLSAIEFLRENGGEFGIEPLMEIYFSTPYPEVRNSIGSLISDIKDNKLEKTITDNVLKYIDSQYLSEFLSNLWQSTLKFSDLSIFIELFVKGDDKTAFEIITIIEQSFADAGDESKNKAIELLKQNTDKIEKGFKHDLAVGLLGFLNS